MQILKVERIVSYVPEGRLRRSFAVTMVAMRAYQANSLRAKEHRNVQRVQRDTIKVKLLRHIVVPAHLAALQ